MTKLVRYDCEQKSSGKQVFPASAHKEYEAYVDKTGDTTPIEYLVARFIGSTPALIEAARQERGQRLLAEAIALMRDIAPAPTRVRR